MNILQVNSIFSGGGVDSQTLVLCAGLHEAGVPVWLAAPDSARLRPGAEACLQRRFIGIAGNRLQWLRQLIRVVRAHQIDLIHAHHGRDYWLSIIAARLSGRRCKVLVSRHLMTELSAASRHLLLNFAHVAAVSDAVHAVLRKTLRGRVDQVRRIYGGVDLRRFAPADAARAGRVRLDLGWPDRCLIFGLVAHLNPPRGKGHLEFVEAARLLSLEQPDAHFLIVGDGPMGEVVRARIRELAMGHRVRLLPFCDDVERYLGAIDVLVHPAVAHEALGIVLWEAMACGKPVIASSLDGIPEAFVDGLHGLLVPPGDVQALVGAMRRLAVERGLRQSMGAAGRSYVGDRFSKARYAQRYLAVYRDIVADRRR